MEPRMKYAVANDSPNHGPPNVNKPRENGITHYSTSTNVCLLRAHELVDSIIATLLHEGQNAFKEPDPVKPSVMDTLMENCQHSQILCEKLDRLAGLVKN